MEKEQKKLLLVAVSVGVFLLITITVAAVVLTPRVNREETLFSSSHPLPAQRYQVTEITGDVSQVQVQPEPVEAAGIRETAPVLEPVDRNDGNQLTINIPRPATAAVPDNQNVPAARQQVVIQEQRTAAPARPAAQETTAAVSVTTPPAAARPAAVRQTPQRTPSRAINDYWVQTGAFSAMIRAEDAKEALASKGITSIIENRVIDGRIWYRVRLGPYTSEKEANYWLTLVQAIDGFEESQVRQTIRQN